MVIFILRLIAPDRILVFKKTRIVCRETDWDASAAGRHDDDDVASEKYIFYKIKKKDFNFIVYKS